MARERAERERVPNVGFVQADAQTHSFPPAAFDVAVSRNGAMFFDDPVAAFINIARALRPGGRLVLLAWQPFERNEWLTAVFAALSTGGPVTPFPPDGPGPFGLSDPERVRAVLGAAGYADIRLTGMHRPGLVGRRPGGRRCAFSPGSAPCSWRELDPVGRAVALDALRASLTDHHTRAGCALQLGGMVDRGQARRAGASAEVGRHPDQRGVPPDADVVRRLRGRLARRAAPGSGPEREEAVDRGPDARGVQAVRGDVLAAEPYRRSSVRPTPRASSRCGTACRAVATSCADVPARYGSTSTTSAGPAPTAAARPARSNGRTVFA